MSRRTLPFAMGLLLAVAACGPAEVVVSMEIENPSAEADGTLPLSDIEVQLLPYDRDQVFDSLTQAFGTPEPEIPAELEQAREEVQTAQAEWDTQQRRWNTLRDTLQTLTDAMEQFSRGEARYVALFREWQDFDTELTRVERQMNDAFDRFDSLQRGTIRASDSIRVLQNNWADEAFAGVGDIFLAKQRATGLDIAVDTTNASGVARLSVAPGQYWVHARYDLPYTELYWNVPLTVERGDPVVVELDRANAQERPKL